MTGMHPVFIGAGERIRTPDRLITNQLLYRLSYASAWILFSSATLTTNALSSWMRNFQHYPWNLEKTALLYGFVHLRQQFQPQNPGQTAFFQQKLKRPPGRAPSCPEPLLIPRKPCCCQNCVVAGESVDRPTCFRERSQALRRCCSVEICSSTWFSLATITF